MLFDKSRVYTVVNAEELKPGDKVIVADTMTGLKIEVNKSCDADAETLNEVTSEDDEYRFKTDTYYHLAYLVERKENCTNCGCVHCWYRKKHRIDEQRLHTCSKRIESKTEQKVEKQYRPFVNTDELIKVWCDKGGKWQKRELTMPHIWLRNKVDHDSRKSFGTLITNFYGAWVKMEGEPYYMRELFEDWEFLDGSPCGVFEGWEFLDGSPCGVKE